MDEFLGISFPFQGRGMAGSVGEPMSQPYAPQVRPYPSWPNPPVSQPIPQPLGQNAGRIADVVRREQRHDQQRRNLQLQPLPLPYANPH